ncbi:MAG: aminopeptidase P family protein [candidate division WS1 bacterium]|nr:aminopeptidase P family protein [candidate division WS1 bacterium]
MACKIAIPKSEFQKRWATLQEKMAEANLDVLIAHGDEADASMARYLSDYWPLFETAGVAIGREGDPIQLIGPETLTFAKDRSKCPHIMQLLEYREPAEPEFPGMELATFEDVIAQASGGKEVKRIGIAGMPVMPVTVYDALKKARGKARLIRADDLIVDMRTVKSKNELKCMKEAYRISEIATEYVLNNIKPGMTERQVVGLAQAALYENGAEYEGHPTYVLSGKNSTHAIGRPSDKKIKEGELIQLNIGALISGYSSSCGRPICIGKMPAKMRDLVSFGLEAHYKTGELMKAGEPAAEVVLKYEQFVKDSGYEKFLLYGPCHSIGLMEVERPWMERTSKFPLAENMTFQVDTFFQTKSFGLRWENGLRVTKTGIEWLSGKFNDIIEL